MFFCNKSIIIEYWIASNKQLYSELSVAKIVHSETLTKMPFLRFLTIHYVQGLVMNNVVEKG